MDYLISNRKVVGVRTIEFKGKDIDDAHRKMAAWMDRSKENKIIKINKQIQENSFLYVVEYKQKTKRVLESQRNRVK